MKLGSKLRLAALSVALFLLVVLGLLHTPPVQNFLFRKAAGYLLASQDIALEADRFRFNLFALSAELRGASLTSAKAPGLVPFLQIDLASVNLSAASLLRGRAVIDEAHLEGVRTRILVDQQGRDNLPSPPEDEEPPGDPNAPLPFLIRSLDLRKGSFVYANEQQNLWLELPEWLLRIDGDPAELRHSIRLETRQPGRASLQGRSISLPDLDIDAAFEAGLVELRQVRLASDVAEIALTGTLKDFAQPVLNVEATAHVEMRQASAIAGLEPPAGGRLDSRVSITGPLSKPVIEAELNGADLSYRDYSRIRLDSKVRLDLAAATLDVESLHLNSPVGSVNARLTLALKEDATSSVEADLRAVDLETISRREKLPVRIASRATADLTAQWPGTQFEKARGRARLGLAATRPSASENLVPVAADISVNAQDGVARLNLASLKALGTRWSGDVSLHSMKRLGGGVAATLDDVAETIREAERFLGREEGSLIGVPVEGGLEIAAKLGGTIDRPQVSANIDAPALQVAQLENVSIQARAEYSPDKVRVEELQLTWANQALVADGEIGLAGQRAVAANLRIAQASLPAILAGLGRKDPIDGTFDLAANAGGTLDNLTARVSLSAAGLKAYGEPLGTLAVEANLSGQQLALSKFQLEKPLAEGGTGSLSATGTYDLTARVFSLQAEAKDLNLDSLTLPGDLPVRAGLNFSASGSGAIDDPSVSAELNVADVRIGERALGDLTAAARVQQRQAEIEARLPRFNVSLNGNLGTEAPYPAEFRITADGTDFSTFDVMLAENEPLEGQVTAQIEASGNLDAWQDGRVSALISSVAATIREQQIRNEGPIEFGIEDRTLTVSSAELVAGNSTLSAGGSLPLEGPGATNPLNVRGNLDIAGLLNFIPGKKDFSAEGKVNLDASVGGSFQKLDPSVQLTLRDGFFDRPDLKVAVTGVTVDARYEKGLVRIDKASAYFGPATLTASGSVPVAALISGLPLATEPIDEPAKFALEVKDFELRAFETLPEDVSSAIGFRVEGQISDLDDLNALSAKVTFQQLQFKIKGYEIRQDASAELSVENGGIRIERFVLTGPETRLEASGTAGLTGDRPLDARLAGDLDLSVLGLFVEGLRATGDTRFEIALAGRPQAPELSGFLELQQAQAGVASPQILAEDLNVRIAFTSDRIDIEEFAGTLNGGALDASGSLGYKGTKLDNVNVDISTKDSFFNVPQGLRTQIQADLRIRSKGELVVIGGDVDVVEGVYRETVRLEGGLLSLLEPDRGVELTEERSPFLSNLRYNVSVQTVNPLIVDNNLAKLAVEANVRLVGSYYAPSIVGRIELQEGGKLYLQEKEYGVERGIVSFVNETRIEPIVDVLARTRASGYDIDLRMSGGGPQKLDVTFTSSSHPELSQPDIIAILLTGRKLEELQGAELAAASQVTQSYLAGRVGGRFSRAAEETLGLSQVRIEPNLIAAESDPTARLTVGQDITNFLRLIYSMNLRDSSDQIWITEYDVTRRFNSRAIIDEDNDYRFEFRHDLRLGGAPEPPRPARARVERRIGRITFGGDPSFPEKTLSEKLGLKSGARYDFFKVQKGIERLERFYFNQHRLEARMRVERETQERTLDLTINIDAGPEVEFIYEGRDASGDLRKRVRQIWWDGIFEAQRADESTAAIRSELVKDGYLQAKVEYEIKPVGDAAKRVIFVIEPGRRFRNVELVFEGAAGIDPARLQKIVKEERLTAEIHTNPKKVTDLLRSYYMEQGYLEATLDKPRYELNADAGTGKVIIPVEEGPLFQVGALEFSGNRALPDSRLGEAIPLSAGTKYQPALLQTSLNKLEDTYWADGYSDVVINYALQRRSDEGLVDVTFHIAENQQSFVEKVEVEGTRSTSEKFVRNQVGISEGEVLDVNQTGKARMSLYETGAYSLVDLQAEPVGAGDRITDPNRKPVALRVKVREVKPFHIGYGAFYDTDRGPGVIADFVNRNSLLGPARVLGIRTRYDSDIREFRPYFSQPLLRQLPLKTNIIGSLRRELFRDPDSGETNFIADTTGFRLQQETHFQNRMILSYGYRFDRTHTFDVGPDPFFDATLNIAPLTLSFTRETRNDLLDATRGSLTSHAVEWAPSKLGSDLQFVKYFGQYFKYLPLSRPVEIPWSGVRRPRLVYAGGARVGLGKGLAGQDLVITERFFAGGGTSIRGFKQDELGPRDFLGDPAGGDAVFITNNELRFPLISIFDGVGFLDIGNVYEKLGDFDPFNVRKTAGLGLRARTPYFLLRFDFGFKLDRKPGESIGSFFVSIGQAF